MYNQLNLFGEIGLKAVIWIFTMFVVVIALSASGCTFMGGLLKKIMKLSKMLSFKKINRVEYRFS